MAEKFSTLPHGFHLHYEDAPKTPEREVVTEKAAPPKPYRIRRRPRPQIETMTAEPLLISTLDGANDFDSFPHHAMCIGGLDGTDDQDIPLPSIEGPDSYEPIGRSSATIINPQSMQSSRYLSPDMIPERTWDAPKTPELQVTPEGWTRSGRYRGGGPMPRSIAPYDDLSDDSDLYESSDDNTSFSEEAHSPISDTSDNFWMPQSMQDQILGSPRKRPAMNQTKSKPKFMAVNWTPAMDRHLWTAYTIYLEDPTNTPFKAGLGNLPPSGAATRIARYAKKTWGVAAKGSRNASSTAGNQRNGTPDTIKVEKSGSNTPTNMVLSSLPPWPTSSKATRQRLKELCKRRSYMSPHYSRMMQSRSPSPFSRSSPQPVPFTRTGRMKSKQPECSAFGTRDVQISLAASTSVAMQPNGPLAQLSRPPPAPMFQYPPVHHHLGTTARPWASPAPIPSDPEIPSVVEDVRSNSTGLGSPFGYPHHTWSHTRARTEQPARPTISTDDGAGSIPRLKSPVHLHGTFPNQKRRAQHQLEEEHSPRGSHMAPPSEYKPYDATPGARRRVRTRGNSMGDDIVTRRLAALFAPPPNSTLATPSDSGSPRADADQSNQNSATFPRQRLASPFGGIGGRPVRQRRPYLPPNHMSSPLEGIQSIDQRLDQSNKRGLFR